MRLFLAPLVLMLFAHADSVPFMMQSVIAAGREKEASSVGIINVEKGDIKIVKAPNALMENLLAVNPAQKRFVTFIVTENAISVRTISYNGDVIDTRSLSGLRVDGIQSLIRFMAYSKETEIFAYYDDLSAKALSMINFKTGQSVQVLGDIDVELLHLVWVDGTKLLLVINEDRSPTKSLSNSIALLDTIENGVEVLYNSKNKFDQVVLPNSFYPENSFKLSPNGKKFLFSQQSGPNEGTGCNLQILDLQTKEVFPVTLPEDQTLAQYGCWNADGTQIAYVEQKRVKLSTKESLRTHQIYDSERTVNIFSSEHATTARVSTLSKKWMPHDLAFLDNDTLLLGFENEGLVNEHAVVLIDKNSGETKRLLKGKFVSGMIAVDGGKIVLANTWRL